MNFVKLVFEEHKCCINHKETSMALSARSRIWRETSRVLYLPQMTSSEVAIALFFAQPLFKPIRVGKNFHSCNNNSYFLHRFRPVYGRQRMTSWFSGCRISQTASGGQRELGHLSCSQTAPTPSTRINSYFLIAREHLCSQILKDKTSWSNLRPMT